MGYVLINGKYYIMITEMRAEAKTDNEHIFVTDGKKI